MTYKANASLLKTKLWPAFLNKGIKAKSIFPQPRDPFRFRIHLIHLKEWGGHACNTYITQKANGGGPEQVMTKQRILKQQE